MTLQVLDEFRGYIQREPLPGKNRMASRNTIDAYGRSVRLFLQWFLETNGMDDADFKPSMIVRDDVREYVSFLRIRGMSPATVRQRMAALSTFFKWATSRGLAQSDETEGVPLPSRQQLAPKGLDRRQRRALIRALNAPPLKNTPAAKKRAVRNRAIVLTLMYVGLRVSELVALRLCDLTLRERSGEITVRSGKGDKDRTVAVSVEARRALRAWLDVRPEVEHDFVFSQTRFPYNPLGARSAETVVREIGHQANLNITPHTLRHTTVYMWKEAGVEPFAIAAQMGHRSMGTTMRYGKPRLDDLHRAAAKIDGDDA